MSLDASVTYTWYGHSCYQIDTPAGLRILIDPWFSNPSSPRTPESVDRCDVMLVTHGHFDHLGDAVPIASRTRPAWPCIHEMSLWLARRLPGGQDAATGMNKGGTVEVKGIKVTMVTADHSAGDWSAETGTPLYLGEPVGFVVELENGHRFYFAGDTSIFVDFRRLGDIYRPDVCFLPIGDHYTMGPREAALAVELLGADTVVPLHYGTFPILTGTPDRLREALAERGLTAVRVLSPEPGGVVS
jgi:L-ascorbate metabolism protein UlaG (beta-lactamase superfamily)